MTELSWWYIVILIDPQSIKVISSLTPTSNMVIFICSCHSGLGEQECQPFLSTACEMRLMASDHWFNRVPGESASTVSEQHWPVPHLWEMSPFKSIWSLMDTQYDSCLSGCYPALELHWVVGLKAPSQNHYHLETPIPSSTHCLLNRILGGIQQFIF